MDNGGTFTLAALQITTALTTSIQTAIIDLDGMSGVTLVAQFVYGSGGSNVVARAQTTFDGGTYWYDVARFDFGTSSDTKYCNLTGLTPANVTSFGTVALGSNSVIDSVLGDQLRLVIDSSGTYANTTLAVRAAVR